MCIRDRVINDTVEAHIDTVALCIFLRDRVRADIEADDDGVRGTWLEEVTDEQYNKIEK